MLRKLLTMALAVLLMLSLSASAYARSPIPDQPCSIAVTLSADTKPLEGAELAIYRVASSAEADYDQFYAYTDAFRPCGYRLTDPELADKLSAYAEENALKPTAAMVTDAQGEALCGDLPMGLYLVKQLGQVDGFAPCAPFLVTVPVVTDSTIVYDVNATPKTEVTRLANITVKKVWLADETVKIPGSVTVELLRGEEVIETAVLSAENSWQLTYNNLPRSDEYSIRETNVPKGFTPVYAQDGDVFTVYNTATLAQTGQTVWPIPVLAAAGLFFLLIGFVLLRKPGRDHA